MYEPCSREARPYCWFSHVGSTVVVDFNCLLSRISRSVNAYVQSSCICMRLIAEKLTCLNHLLDKPSAYAQARLVLHSRDNKIALLAEYMNLAHLVSVDKMEWIVSCHDANAKDR